MTVSDFILQRVHAWGIRRIYGYPGDGINGIMGAFDRLDGAIDFIQVRHEEMAAFMATADAKYTGEVACCLATSGPGAIHLLNGLYDAKMDHRPVVAIVGQAATTAIGGNYQQEVDLVNLFKDVASEYVYQISSPMAARHIVDRAFRIAHATRSVTCIIVPKDIQEMDAVEHPPHAANTLQSGVGYSAPVVIPTAFDLAAAAEILNSGERVAMLVGAGTLGAPDEVMAVADRLQAGVAKALARQGGVARRSAVRDRNARSARHRTEFGYDVIVRYAFHDRYDVSVRAISSESGPGARRSDRSRRQESFDAFCERG